MSAFNDNDHERKKERWHKVKNPKDDLQDQLRALAYPIRPHNGLSLEVESLILLCRTKHPDLQECDDCHVVHRSSENYRRHSQDHMPDPEEIEMRRLWHAGQLVEPRVKLMRLRAVQEDAIISIDSGYYYRGEENPLPPLAELRTVLVPLDRREKEAAAQVTKVQARADELEVLNRQIQAELSSKESQLDLAERLNQNLQSQLVNQAALASTNTALQEQVQSLRSDNQKTMDEREKWLPLVEKAGQVELLHKRIQDLERALSKANEEKARLIEERAEGERQRKELERSTHAEIKKLLQVGLLAK